jgi:hypothetical protein
MTYFRVFRSVMAARSPIFKDLLSLPQPMYEEKVDGCDVVHLLGDDPEDVAVFLKAIFDSRLVVYIFYATTGIMFLLTSFFEPPPSMTTMPTIAGILGLSTKYEVFYLRRRALKHLDTLYPTSLAAFFPRQERWTTPAQMGTAFYVASLGREFGLDWLMPSSLFCVSGYPVEDIMNGFLWEDNRETAARAAQEGSRETEESTTGKRIKLVEEDRLACLRALSEI